MVEVSVRDPGLCGMINLRCDLAVLGGSLAGAAVPGIGGIVVTGDLAMVWMSPDELLLILPQDGVTALLARISDILQGVNHLALDVTDARAVFTLTGSGAREVIAKLAPVDLHPASFGAGTFRRSRLGQVAAAFWMDQAGDIHVMCFRSVADYALALLKQSAKDGAVGLFV